MSELRWITVWSRAVVVPAWQRGVATWLGCAIVGAVVFGPTAMRPSDLTGLAIHDPGVGAVLGGTWLLVFVPTARMIVRPRVGYLYSLPGDPRAARAVAVLALIGLQLPWLVLWLAGAGALGAGVVAATTVVAAGLARWQPPRRSPRTPGWRRAGAALRAIHVRALGRRAGDALTRGAGLAVLAGIAGGLLVRNNELVGGAAGVFGASVIAVVSIPAQAGAALVALATHRETAWLAASSGISRATRIGSLIYAVAAIHLAVAAIASLAAMIVAGANPWLPVLALATALATALGVVRAMLVHEASPTVAARVVIGGIVAAAAVVLCLSVLGEAGALAAIALGVFAVLMVKP
ncbi:MAG TPA: hypothetical protein VH165_15870 [Kofleriaceae bacterium]|nr:hypothetical protein [Kofleriaceae bacterium]